jgi:anaerobic magnesium-protoporphyrin IX monomethyl ester cyclase
MGEIADRFDNVSFSPNLFTPYPGIPIWDELKALGLNPPSSLEGWADIGLGQAQLPWLSAASSRTLNRGMSYFLLDNQINKTRRRSKSPAFRAGLRLIRKPLHWRLRHHFFDLPLELWISMARQWLVVRRSLLTGDALGYSLSKTN